MRNGEKIVAFTVGEELCKDTFVVHIEKAFADVQGAYPMINQQFVEHECMDYSYVNREDDAGKKDSVRQNYLIVRLFGRERVCDKNRRTAMISKKVENMVANSSAIRAMFEEGNRLGSKIRSRECI